MAVIRLVDSVKHSMLEQLKTAIDSGTSPGVIDIYSGLMPVNPTVAPTIPSVHKLLGTLTFSDPCCATVGVPTAGSLTFDAIVQDSSADETGIASWARISAVTSGVKTTVCDIDITSVGGGGTMQMNTTNVIQGGPILISNYGSFSL